MGSVSRNIGIDDLCMLLISAIDWVGKDPSIEGHVGAERLGVFYPRGVSGILPLRSACEIVTDRICCNVGHFGRERDHQRGCNVPAKRQRLGLL